MEGKPDTELQQSLHRLKEESSKKTNQFSFLTTECLDGWDSINPPLIVPSNDNPESERDMFLDFDAATSIYREHIKIQTKQKQSTFPCLEHTPTTIDNAAPITVATAAPTGGAAVMVTSATSAAEAASLPTQQNSKDITPKTLAALQALRSASPKMNFRGHKSDISDIDNKKKRVCQKITRSSSADAVTTKPAYVSFSKFCEGTTEKRQGSVKVGNSKMNSWNNQTQKASSKRDTQESSVDSSVIPETLSAKALKRMHRSRPWRISQSPQLLSVLDTKFEHDAIGIPSATKEKGNNDQMKGINAQQRPMKGGSVIGTELTDIDKGCGVKVSRLDDMRIDGSRKDFEMLNTTKNTDKVTQLEKPGAKSNTADDKPHVFRIDNKQEGTCCPPFGNTVAETVQQTAETATTENEVNKDGAKKNSGGVIRCYGGDGGTSDAIMIKGKELSEASDLPLFTVGPAPWKSTFQSNVKKLERPLTAHDPNHSLANAQQEANTTSIENPSLFRTSNDSMASSQKNSQRSKIPIAVSKKLKPGSPEKPQTSKNLIQESSKWTLNSPRSKSAPLESQRREKKFQNVKFSNDDKKDLTKPSASVIRNMGSYHQLYCANSVLSKNKKNFAKKSFKKLSFTDQTNFRRDSSLTYDDQWCEKYSDNVYGEWKPCTANTEGMNDWTQYNNIDASEYRDFVYDRDHYSKNRLFISNTNPYSGILDDYDIPEGKYGLRNTTDATMPKTIPSSPGSSKGESQRHSWNYRTRAKQPPFTQTKRGRYFVDIDGNQFCSSGRDFSNTIESSVHLKSQPLGKQKMFKPTQRTDSCFGQEQREMVWNPTHQEGQIMNYINQIRNDRENRNGFGNEARGVTRPHGLGIMKGDDSNLIPKSFSHLEKERDSYALRNKVAKSRRSMLHTSWPPFPDRCVVYGESHGRRKDRSPTSTISNVYTQTNHSDGADDYHGSCGSGVGCSYYGAGGIGGDGRVDECKQVMKGPRSDGSKSTFNSEFGNKRPSDYDKAHSEYTDDVNADDGDDDKPYEDFDKDGHDDEDEEEIDAHYQTHLLGQCTSHQNAGVDERILKEFDAVLTTLYAETRQSALKAEKVKRIIDEVVSKNLDFYPDGSSSGRVKDDNDDGVDNQFEGTFGDFLLLVGFMLIQIFIHLIITDKLGH